MKQKSKLMLEEEWAKPRGAYLGNTSLQGH